MKPKPGGFTSWRDGVGMSEARKEPPVSRRSEQARETGGMWPGDIVFWRDEKFGVNRFWEIESVLLGAAGQESLIRIRSLNFRAGENEDGHMQETLLVPEPLIRGRVYSWRGPDA